MKQRIKELADQAGFKTFAGPDIWAADSDDEGRVDTELNKFVELLVAECAKVINADIEYQIKDGVISNVHGLNQARNLIKEHFGVE